MKRRGSPNARKYHAKIGDIQSDFTPEQLAAIGAIAMNYNETEGYIETIFGITARLLDNPWHFEISARVPLDAKIDFIKRIADHYLTPDDARQLQTALGDDRFGKIRSHRNAVIHARILNAPLATGQHVKKPKVAVEEVLLSKSALDKLYNHISAVRLELTDASYLLTAVMHYLLAPPNHPAKASIEAALPALEAKFRAHRQWKLDPLDEVPSEIELIAARDKWFKERMAAQMAWFQPLSEPQFPHRR